MLPPLQIGCRGRYPRNHVEAMRTGPRAPRRHHTAAPERS